MAALARTMLALALALPCIAQAQGTGPMQGTTQPQPQPTPPGGPPVPRAEEIGNGRPRQDPGGGQTDTSPGTTSSLPLPPAGQADPVPKK
ncbi:hypothetical protein [Paracraurococcus lichenis]|uniref:Uncharacterized protein n=1 Tax=Paracraurococcus lichenis TaxID=3064888 RepID=A0ABT9E8B0_9PROT|nr:hypothetical protein [Paracraurococcus sp. LOR1-02]MDO9712413.1 hypothetical protein [Paracraurococcus sp. LOR1-02]